MELWVLQAVFPFLGLPDLAAAAQVCRLWREALEGGEAAAESPYGTLPSGEVWRAVALRHLPWHATGGGEEVPASEAMVDDQRSIEERKRQLWGRPAVVAPDIPLHAWKQTLRCVVEVFRCAGELLESRFTVDAWHDMNGTDRGWNYEVWHHALHMLKQHDIIVKKAREVHSYGVSDTGRVCLAEGSPEMVIYERVPPEGMFMVDLKEWAANRDVKGINQALALGWIVILDEVEDTEKRQRAAADPLVLNPRKSLARVVRNVVEPPKDEVREQLALIDRHSHEDNRGLLPKGVYANLKRRMLIHNNIARTYRMSRGIQFVSSVGEMFRIFAACRDQHQATGHVQAADQAPSPRDDVRARNDAAGPDDEQEKETVVSHKTKYFQMHKGFFREERDVVTSVNDMLMAIDKIEKYSSGIRDLDHWINPESEMVVDAVFHNLVLLGEAGGITMNELLRRERENDHPIPRPAGVDWEELVVMRNNIIHKYFIFLDDLTRRTRMKQAWQLVRKLIDHGRPALRTLLLALQQAQTASQQ